jgi:hypothetical protein
MMRPHGDPGSGEDELTIRSCVRSRCRVVSGENEFWHRRIFTFSSVASSLDLGMSKSINLTLQEIDFELLDPPHDKVSNDPSWLKKLTTRLSTKVLTQNRLRERLALLSKKVSIVKCLMFLESST